MVRVEVEEDEDRDGTRILRVRVIYDEGGGSLQVAAMLELPNEIRNALEADEPPGFPVVSYVDVKEEPTLHAAR